MVKTKVETKLEIYSDRSILFKESGTKEVFEEGDLDDAQKERLLKIKKAYENGFFRQIIEDCQNPEIALPDLKHDLNDLLERLVQLVTSEVGRAIVGLTVLQLTIKAIMPSQNIRLHKGGGKGKNFSWKEGIPMRVLDKNYNTPILREFGLLKVNADGVFMTRSLAENYPYSKLYKAAIRGARDEWLSIVDIVQNNECEAIILLKHLISKLINRSDKLKILVEKVIQKARKKIQVIETLEDALSLVKKFVDKSTYSARIFEIAMHSFYQALEELDVFYGYSLKPLSQMRSANKKHGNIGDIEIVDIDNEFSIIKSWDAKYGKAYLRDELEELNDKLQLHPETTLAGFVVDGAPDLKKEIIDRKNEIEAIHNIDIKIMDLKSWILEEAKNAKQNEALLAKKWLTAFIESICQKRRSRAPIDEPSDVWVKELLEFFD